MRPTLFALALTALATFASPASTSAQDVKVARGTITAIGARSISVKVSGQNMTFSVDSKTIVEARGASTKSRRAAAAGKPGPHLDELLQKGQTVSVYYNEKASDLQATEIKAVKNAAEPKPSAPETMTSTGVVKSIGADSITIKGGVGASSEQTFELDPSTKVFARGAGSTTAAKGGRALVSDLVANGDHVSISYYKAGGSLYASMVRVTTKAFR